MRLSYYSFDCTWVITLRRGFGVFFCLGLCGFAGLGFFFDVSAFKMISFLGSVYFFV